MNDNMTVDTAKAYELRNLIAEDVFPMFKIISKIGIDQFKNCFDSPDVKAAVAAASSEDGQADLTTIGMSVAFDLASVIVSNIGNCKNDIYLLLSQLSGMDTKDIAALPMVTFFEMIIDVIKKEEFKDFFQVVTKLFK